eukprot:scaffold6760_cov119-Isochrysis_galbana.AAC.7
MRRAASRSNLSFSRLAAAAWARVVLSFAKRRAAESNSTSIILARRPTVAASQSFVLQERRSCLGSSGCCLLWEFSFTVLYCCAAAGGAVGGGGGGQPLRRHNCALRRGRGGHNCALRRGRGVWGECRAPWGVGPRRASLPCPCCPASFTVHGQLAEVSESALSGGTPPVGP